MSDVRIQVRDLAKRYLLAHQTAGGDGLRHRLEAALTAPFRRLARRPRPAVPAANHRLDVEEFWALKDVSFDVKRGDVVGIIGRNGAGKSTLLKILSRITEPTQGRIHIKGRVASLLEVGTGFHPELTGRENIFLNGSILGMRRAEIKAKFDAIVAFAEIERFLDTPVKRYSSGMYVRLAFAVAAHLEPEILIVDEVLAVGDAQFQKKCLGKMGEVARQAGRTVLFVSHQMAAVANLCRSCLVMKNGTVEFQGPTETAIRRYLEIAASKSTGNGRDLAEFRASWARPYITAARVLNGDHQPQDHFALGAGLCLELTFDTRGAGVLKKPVMGIVIKHAILGTAGGVNMRMTGFDAGRGMASGTMRCRLPRLPLLQGNYSVDLWLGDGPTDVDMVAEYLTFTVEDADVYGTGQIPFANLGLIYLEPSWEFIATK